MEPDCIGLTRYAENVDSAKINFVCWWSDMHIISTYVFHMEVCNEFVLTMLNHATEFLEQFPKNTKTYYYICPKSVLFFTTFSIVFLYL